MNDLKKCKECLWYSEKRYIHCELDGERIVPDEPQCDDFDEKNKEQSVV